MSSRIRSTPTSSSERWPFVDARLPQAPPSTASRSSGGTSRRSIKNPGAVALGVLAVGGDDALHELVADDVVGAEADEADVGDRGEDLADDDQAGALVARQVDLGDVAGDHHPEPNPSRVRNIFICSGRGVLSLVEDHERIVDRAAAHEGQRRHLDDVALEVGRDLLRVEHVVERVEERAQVRVDLRLDVAGQEAQALAGLDRGAGEDDPADVARDSSAATAQATARKVLPVPAGPMPKVIVLPRIEST